MTAHYPLNFNFKSEEFNAVKDKLLGLLNSPDMLHVQTTVFAHSDIENALKVTFTILHSGEYMHLRADAMFERWVTKQSTAIPQYILSNFSLTRSNYNANDDISKTLTYIFTEDTSLMQKYSERFKKALVEYRDNRVQDLTNSVNRLLREEEYGGW